MGRRCRQVVMGLALLAGLAQAGWAQTFIVTSREDSGHGTLREAVDAANTTTGMQMITFAVPNNNSITVYTPINISDPITIDGGGVQVVGSINQPSIIGNGYVLHLNSGSSGSIVKNLAIVGWVYPLNTLPIGIEIDSDGNSIIGCRIGTDWIDND